MWSTEFKILLCNPTAGSEYNFETNDLNQSNRPVPVKKSNKRIMFGTSLM